MPRFIWRCPPLPLPPPERKPGFAPTGGLPEPPAPPAAGPFVAIAVGKTKDGASLPANPSEV